MKKLAIIGSGDLGQLIAYHCENDKQAEVVGFFDDFKRKGEIVELHPILGGTKDIETLFLEHKFDELIVAIGYHHFDFRQQVFEDFKGKVPFARLIHSSCYVDDSCELGEGVCLLPGSVLDRNVKIKSNVLLNIDCTIAHDSIINEHSFLSPRVAIAGYVNIGERCNIGINSTIIDNITIANDVQTGGGSVIIRTIKESGVYVGNPIRKIK